MMYSSSIFILVVFALSASAQEESQKVIRSKSAEAQCGLESGIDPMRSGSTERERMCFGACVLRKRGTLREDGTLYGQREIENLVLTEDSHIQAINLCANEKGEDDCETVRKFLNCLVDQRLPYEWLMHREGPVRPLPYRNNQDTPLEHSTSTSRPNLHIDCEKNIFHPQCRNTGDDQEKETAKTADIAQ